VDWWALGVLIHEMLAGYSPFYHEDKMTTYEKIMDPSPLQLPHYFDSLAKDLIKRLLVQDRTKRLGFKVFKKILIFVSFTKK
jgi:serine/threonine protein kinase